MTPLELSWALLGSSWAFMGDSCRFSDRFHSFVYPAPLGIAGGTAGNGAGSSSGVATASSDQGGSSNEILLPPGHAEGGDTETNVVTWALAGRSGGYETGNEGRTEGNGTCERGQPGNEADVGEPCVPAPSEPPCSAADCRPVPRRTHGTTP